MYIKFKTCKLKSVKNLHNSIYDHLNDSRASSASRIKTRGQRVADMSSHLCR